MIDAPMRAPRHGGHAGMSEKPPPRDFLQPQTNYVEWLEAENDRLRELVREARSDFSVAMPFVAGEHGGSAQRSWHERARAALWEQA